MSINLLVWREQTLRHKIKPTLFWLVFILLGCVVTVVVWQKKLLQQDQLTKQQLSELSVRVKNKDAALHALGVSEKRITQLMAKKSLQQQAAQNFKIVLQALLKLTEVLPRGVRVTKLEYQQQQLLLVADVRQLDSKDDLLAALDKLFITTVLDIKNIKKMYQLTMRLLPIEVHD